MGRWTRLILFLVLSAWACESPPVQAAVDPTNQKVLQSAAVATGNGNELDTMGMSSVALQVTIAVTATVTFEATADGTTYVSTVCFSAADTSGASVTTATASGAYQCNVSGMALFRARVSAWTSGAVTVFARATTAVFAKRANGLPAIGSEGQCLTVTGGIPAWTACTFTEADTLDTAFDRGKVIDGANSLANAVQIGDQTTRICLYTDATLGPQVRPCTDANVLTIIPTNFNWSLWDVEGASAIETVDPDAASKQAIWTYALAYRPLKSAYVPAGALNVDGTQCGQPTERTINSGSLRYTIICTDNDASTIYGEFDMPDAWDGGTVTLMGRFVQTAADTNPLNADVAMACRASGTTINNTWGTEIAMDIANMGGSNKTDTVTTAAITPNGTCTGAGTLLQFRWQLDATGTTTAVATLHVLDFKLIYAVKSRSD